MLFLDVNVCVHARRPAKSADAERVRAWVETKLVGPRPVGLSEQVLASMIPLPEWSVRKTCGGSSASG